MCDIDQACAGHSLVQRRATLVMASYSLEEFLGEGLLKDLGAKFADDGWDDVPTIKVIGADDMEALELTDAQRVRISVVPLLISWVCSVWKNGD